MKHIIDDLDKNKYEAYTKQEVLEVIQEAISTGELPEEINGLVLTLKNPVDNQGYKIAFCTQAKYNELEQAGELEENCYYYITDDSTLEDWENYIDQYLEEKTAALPRTKELMQGEAQEGDKNIPINEMTDTNNYVEVTGYYKEPGNNVRYLFSQRIKPFRTGGDVYRTSIVYQTSIPPYNDPKIQIECQINYASSPLKMEVFTFKAYDKDGNQISGYTIKILSVKELINY